MNTERAILSIAMLAAFADGAKDESEREHVKQFAEQLGSSSVELMGVYQDVLFKRITLNDAATALQMRLLLPLRPRLQGLWPRVRSGTYPRVPGDRGSWLDLTVS